MDEVLSRVMTSFKETSWREVRWRSSVKKVCLILRLTEVLAALREVDPTCDTGFNIVSRWVQNFTNGRSEALEKYSSGRPVSVTNEENTVIVAQILKTDRRFTCEEITHETGVSRSSVHTILFEQLGMKKTTDSRVPYFLSKTGGNMLWAFTQIYMWSRVKTWWNVL